jgi:1,2-diacylglycerol 3-alpha-glucosyltransferase
LRIAIVCSYYPWPPSFGGVETIVRNVSVELAKRGHDVHVITTPFDVTTMRQVSNYGMEIEEGVVIHKLKPGKVKVGYARFLKGLNSVISEVKPEVIHSHNLHPHLVQLTNWRNKFGYKLIAELHHPTINFDFFIQKMLLPFVAYLLRWKSSSVDAFITHTDLERNWLISKGIDRERIKVIKPPMISSQLISLQEESLSIGDYSADLLYLGRIVPKKGLHVLLKALSLVKDANLVVAGSAEGGYIRKLRKFAEDAGIRERIRFLGPIAERDKLRLITSHKVLVCPTLADYHPIVLVEAQALGVPVVATRVGAIPKIVMDGETGLLVEPNNVQGLAKAIETLLNNDALRLRFSRKAREFAYNFTVERSVEKIEMLYHRILNKSGAVKTLD